MVARHFCNKLFKQVNVIGRCLIKKKCHRKMQSIMEVGFKKKKKKKIMEVRKREREREKERKKVIILIDCEEPGREKKGNNCGKKTLFITHLQTLGSI